MYVPRAAVSGGGDATVRVRRALQREPEASDWLWAIPDPKLKQQSLAHCGTQ